MDGNYPEIMTLFFCSGVEAQWRQRWVSFRRNVTTSAAGHYEFSVIFVNSAYNVAETMLSLQDDRPLSDPKRL